MLIQNLMQMLSDKMGNSRNISEDTLKSVIIQSANDLISEFKQNINIVTYTTQENEKQIKVKNIAQIFRAKFDNKEIPLYRLSRLINEDTNTLKLIVLDTQSVRLEPFSVGELEILGSFYIERDVEEIPLSFLFQRAIIQGATVELFTILDKPLEHIRSAKILLTDCKDELRTHINRAQEKNMIITRNIRI